MKIAIMQPYFFPYIGYFQLINSVDKFVLYDDVNYIKQGWINRNRIISNMEGSYFTLQLQGASSYKNINEIQTGENKNKLAKTIRQVYCKTKYFVSVFPMVESILLNSESNLSLYLENSVRKLCHILCIPTEIFLSSSIKKDNSLKGIEKVISICKLFNAQEYINSIGGEILYKKEVFLENGIRLFILETQQITYPQSERSFIPNLSIIDVLMMCGQEKTKDLLTKYILK